MSTEMKENFEVDEDEEIIHESSSHKSETELNDTDATDKTTSEASEVYEDDFETGDSGLEELILEAGPAPRSKVRKEQQKGEESAQNRRNLPTVVTSPSVGPWERWETATVQEDS